MGLELPRERKEKVALAIYDSKPPKEEMEAGKKPAFLTSETMGYPFFVYNSGRLGPYYIDLRVIPSFPKNFNAILSQLNWLTAHLLSEFSFDIDCIVSTESAGISWGQSIASKLKLPFTYARKKSKDYGTKKIIEGYIPRGAKVLNIDDLVTTLSSIGNAVHGVRDEGAEVVASEVIFNRGQYTKKDLKDLGAPLSWLIDVNDFASIGEKRGRIKKEVAQQILQYHTDEGIYAKKVVEANTDFIRNHSKRGSIRAGYEEAYNKTGNENFGSVVKILKKVL